MTEDAIKKAAEARMSEFFETFKNYGLLLNTLDDAQFGEQIGMHFQNPYQCAIVTTLMARLFALERKHGAEE